MANKGICPLNRGNLFLIVKRDISFFFVLTAHMPGGERQNTMSFDGGNPSMKVKMDIHFFGV